MIIRHFRSGINNGTVSDRCHFQAVDLKFKYSFTCIVSGPTGSGKSSFTLRLLRHLDSLCTEPNFSGGIVWFYSEKSAVPRRELASLHKDVSFHEGVTQNFGNDRSKSFHVIFEDLLNDVYSKDVCDLFTKGSHHRNFSVILITQNLFTRAVSVETYRLTLHIPSL
jgi:ABC-type dipeptide/oligopeptide/nickel transport system ATPase component